MHLEAIRVLCRRSRSEKRNFVEGMKKSRLIGPAHTFPPATGAFSGVIASLADQRSAPAESFKASILNRTRGSCPVGRIVPAGLAKVKDCYMGLRAPMGESPLRSVIRAKRGICFSS